MRKTGIFSDITYSLAKQMLSGEYYRSLVNPPDICVENIPGYQNLSNEMKYAHCIKLIAEKSPVKIIPGEKIVGSAILKGSLSVHIPVKNGTEYAFSSAHHLTPGFDFVLKTGYKGLREQIRSRLEKGGLDKKGIELLDAMNICLDAASVWHRRYINSLKELIAGSNGKTKKNYEQILKHLINVPENPPENFREAVQSLWFMFSFLRLCGNLPGIGRIDEMLGGYLKTDIEKGIITLDEAREILAHFWIKGCEWVGAAETSGGSGDSQFYQNIVLSGIDSKGKDITNDITYFVLDIVEELHIGDFPIAVRISKNTPEKLYTRIAEVQRFGGGIVAVYNEEVVINAMVKGGYLLKAARRFANDGCWEVQVPGETCFNYYAIDIYILLQKTIGSVDNNDIPEYKKFEDLYKNFYEKMSAEIENFHKIADGYADNGDPAELISLFEKDCIEKGRGYFERGARYNVLSPHAGGIPDAANSLLVLKKLVFEEKKIPLKDFIGFLRNNWEGQENLRRYIITRFDFFGNDEPESDKMTKRVLDDFINLVNKVPERNGVKRPAGVSTFGREIGSAPVRGASSQGFKAGTYLATNFSPTPGTDKKGPTSVIKSHCAMDLVRLGSGTAFELKLLPQSVKGAAGIESIKGLLKTFVTLGGFFMQIDCVSNEMLIDAQKNPEKYPNLCVRISGWSARFATLNKEWQDMIIKRTQQK